MKRNYMRYSTLVLNEALSTYTYLDNKYEDVILEKCKVGKVTLYIIRYR